MEPNLPPTPEPSTPPSTPPPPTGDARPSNPTAATAPSPTVTKQIVPNPETPGQISTRPQPIAAAGTNPLEPTCSQCGAVTALDQRYCIECGNPVADSRVPRPQDTSKLNAPPEAVIAPAAQAPFQTATLAHENPDAVRNKYLGLGAGGAALLIAITLGAGAVGASMVRDNTASTQPVVAAAAPPTAATGTTEVSITSDWVDGSGEWTVIVNELPKEGAQQAQIDQAKSALSAKGLDAGVFDSDEVGGPTSGQYVIFSGQYESKKDATAALKDVKAGGFPDARVEQISGSGDGESDDSAAKASDDKLKELESLPAEEQQKERLKLPDEVETEGEKVPEDNKEPGGGSDGVNIGSLGPGADATGLGSTGSTGTSDGADFRLACEWPERVNDWTIIAGERDTAAEGMPRPADSLVRRYTTKKKKAEVTLCVDLQAEKAVDLVYVGWYADQPKAERALKRLKKLGFKMPYVAKVIPDTAPADVVGQIKGDGPTATTTGAGS